MLPIARRMILRNVVLQAHEGDSGWKIPGKQQGVPWTKQPTRYTLHVRNLMADTSCLYETSNRVLWQGNKFVCRVTLRRAGFLHHCGEATRETYKTLLLL